MEIADCPKEVEYQEVKPNLFAKHSSSILTTYGMREENTIAYTQTGSHLTSMDINGIEKYNSNER